MPSAVTWTNDIKKMFTDLDIDHMKSKGIDLSDYQSVKINAVSIYTRVAQGSMPPPGSGKGHGRRNGSIRWHAGSSKIARSSGGGAARLAARTMGKRADLADGNIGFA